MKQILISICISAALTAAAAAQSSLPVEATADDLQINSENNTAVFSGNARIVQGNLNLTASIITVKFDTTAEDIKSVQASGNVKYNNGQETAKAQSAQFNVDTQVIVFTGNVVLKQPRIILTGDHLTYNIKTNKSKMSGHVKTVYKPN